jgi:hypothetical protein
MTTAFYELLAPYYHLLYDDWENSVVKQGEVRAGLLREAGVVPGGLDLDATCEIGTQTLGRLQHGYRLAAGAISSFLRPLRPMLGASLLVGLSLVDTVFQRLLCRAPSASFSRGHWLLELPTIAST